MILFQVNHPKGTTFTTTADDRNSNKVSPFWIGTTVAKFIIHPKPGVQVPGGIIKYIPKRKKYAAASNIS